MRVVRAIIYICLAAIILIAGFKLEVKLNEYRTALDIHTERTMEVRKGRKVDFKKLKAQNEDIKGWIYLPDTNIDHPIVQGEDNDYYLHRDFDRNYLFDGCIFIDAAVLEPFSPDYNTVIYGHRMSSGAMFHDLRNYENKEFFDSHRKIIIETEDRSYDLHVIAFCNELSDSELYVTSFDEESSSLSEFADEFGIPVEDLEESSDENLDENTQSDDSGLMTKADFIDLVKSKAKILSNEHFDENDIYVTLSTCQFSTGDERNQIIGILKNAPEKEKIIEKKTKKPLVNKWLVFQILVGIIMALILIGPIISLARGNKRH